MRRETLDSPARARAATPPATLRLALTLAARTSIRSPGRSILIAALVAIPIAGLSAVVVVAESLSPTGLSAYGEAGLAWLQPLVMVALAFVVFEVILLAGAAFTVAARQQQRSLALLASIGATRGTLFRVVSASGLVLGAVGGLLGSALGVGGAALYLGLSGDALPHGLRLPWLAVGAIVAFAIAIGWVAALLPARVATRIDVVAALRGSRRPPTDAAAQRPVAGVVMLALGVALTLAGGVILVALTKEGQMMPGGHPLIWAPVVVLMFGPILAQMGLIKCGPLLLRAGAVAIGRVGLGARLGARDAARNPARSVPAIAAIMAATFVAVLGMSLAGSLQAVQLSQFDYERMPHQVEVALSSSVNTDGGHEVVRYESPRAVIAALREGLRVDEVRVLSSAPLPLYQGTPDPGVEAIVAPVPRIPLEKRCPLDPASPDFTPNLASDDVEAGLRDALRDPRCVHTGLPNRGDYAPLWVGDAGDLGLVLGHEPSTAARAMLAGGGAVTLYREYLTGDSVELAWLTEPQLYGGEGTFAPEVRVDTLDAVLETAAVPRLYFGVFISPATAESLGIDHSQSTVLASLTHPPSEAQLAAVAAALRAEWPRADAEGLALRRAVPPDFAEPWAWGLLALSGLVAIASAAVAIGLARADGRQDDATLASLGAGRRVQRSFAFWQALLLTGLGSLLGASIGLTVAFALSANPEMQFAPPGRSSSLPWPGSPCSSPVRAGSRQATSGFRRGAGRSHRQGFDMAAANPPSQARSALGSRSRSAPAIAPPRYSTRQNGPYVASA